MTQSSVEQDQSRAGTPANVVAIVIAATRRAGVAEPGDSGGHELPSNHVTGGGRPQQLVPKRGVRGNADLAAPGGGGLHDDGGGPRHLHPCPGLAQALA